MNLSGREKYKADLRRRSSNFQKSRYLQSNCDARTSVYGQSAAQIGTSGPTGWPLRRSISTLCVGRSNVGSPVVFILAFDVVSAHTFPSHHQHTLSFCDADAGAGAGIEFQEIL